MSTEQDRIRAVYEQRLEDGIIDRYSPFNLGELYMLQTRERATIEILRRHGITRAGNAKVLEIGCGRGTRLMDWCRWGAKPSQLAGIDLMEPFIQEAKQMLPSANLTVGSADKLPFRDEQFDIIVQSTVFTSILSDQAKQSVAAELVRVAAPGAIILWYDFRYPNPRNKDVRPIGRSEICRLFPGWSVDGHTLTLLPPLARRLAAISWTACTILELIAPHLRSHYLAVLRKSPLSNPNV